LVNSVISPAMSQSDVIQKSLPLWQLLQQVANVLMAVRAGANTGTALESVPPGMRPAVQSLAFQTLRSLGRAQALRKLLAPRPPAPAADALLCVALALSWRDQDAPYGAFTLVNQAVEAAKRSFATRGQASFINACLRRFLRERTALIEATNPIPQARWNHPPWWIERLKNDHPGNWQAILQASNAHAPMTLRVNTATQTRDACLSRLSDAGIHAFASGDAGVTLVKPLPVHDIPGFAEGHVSVQDAAAQLAAPLLIQGMANTGRLRVLDACAAPGGKTTHLLELGNVEVTALDIDAARCQRIHQNLQRMQLHAEVLTGDAAQPQTWWNGTLFDAILLDAPCTASGIVRRHPDVPWLRRESDIASLALVQTRLLAALWQLLKPGGRLLYCTCSVFKAEGADQMQTFLAHNTNATLLPSPGHLMPHFKANNGTVPDNSQDDHDGFYLALLEKRTP
jgi:16S rRNA (cytosine967-C5)-methyltransferase